MIINTYSCIKERDNNNKKQINNSSTYTINFEKAIKVSRDTEIVCLSPSISVRNGKIAIAWEDKVYVGFDMSMDGFSYRTRYVFSIDGGLSFSDDYLLSDKDAVHPDLCFTDDGDLLLALVEVASPLIKLRRSFDYKKGWQETKTIIMKRDSLLSFSNYSRPYIKAEGNKIHVVCSKSTVSLLTSDHRGIIVYVKSEDGGKTFGKEIKISPKGHQASGICITDSGLVAIVAQEIIGFSNEIFGVPVEPYGDKGFLYLSDNRSKRFRSFIFNDENSKMAPEEKPDIATFDDDIYLLWVGELKFYKQGLFFNSLAKGTKKVNKPRLINFGEKKIYSSPVIAVDRFGVIHSAWIGLVDEGSREFSVFYGYSKDKGQTFEGPYQVTNISFTINRIFFRDGFLNSFLCIAVGENDLFLAWTNPQGREKGVYMSIARNAIHTRR